MNNFNHLMLDLETIGNSSYSALFSIGAVEFDIETGETGKEFYQKIDLQSCFDNGLRADASTIYWWLQQSEAARKEICSGEKHHLIDVLNNFNMFMNELIDDIEIWGNGSRFDIGILEDAYKACKLEIPWKFRKERDVRTLVSFKPEIKNNYPFNDIEHHPIADCKFQIGYCSAIWKEINSNKTNNVHYIANTKQHLSNNK